MLKVIKNTKNTRVTKRTVKAKAEKFRKPYTKKYFFEYELI